MLFRPKHIIEKYINGGRIDYVEPIKFMLVAVGLSTLVYFNSDIMRYYLLSDFQGINDEKEKLEFASKLYFDLSKVVTLGAIPIIAWFCSLLYPKPKWNFTEHLGMQSFIYGFQNFLVFPTMLILLPATWSKNSVLIQYTINISLLLGIIYALYVHLRVFNYSPIENFVRWLIATIAGYLLFFILFFIFASVYVVYDLKQPDSKFQKYFKNLKKGKTDKAKDKAKTAIFSFSYLEKSK